MNQSKGINTRQCASFTSLIDFSTFEPVAVMEEEEVLIKRRRPHQSGPPILLLLLRQRILYDYYIR